MTLAKNLEIVADAVYEKGKQDKLRQFWEMLQHNGTRDDCESMFRNWLMPDDWFYPVYNFNVSAASYMFQRFANGGSVFDLDTRLKECGVTIDISNSTYVTNLFYAAFIDNIPLLDVRKCGNLNSSFAHSRIATIQKLIVAEKATYNQTFYNASYLTHIRFEGAIGNTIDFGACPLDAFSILGDLATEEQIAEGKNLFEFGGQVYFGGIMGALMDNPVGTNPTITFKKSVVEQHFGGTEGGMWLALVGSKPNWNFATK